MSTFPIGAGFAIFVALAFAGLYLLFSTFAQALESLSAIRRKSLLVEDPHRFSKLLSPEHVRVSRVAVRLVAQAAVLGGLLSLGTALRAFDAPEPWLIAAITILLGWIVLEGLVLRVTVRRRPDALLQSFSWLIPVVVLFAAPLYPSLSRLVEKESEEDETTPTPPVEREAAKEAKDVEVQAFLDVAREEGILEKGDAELVSRAVDFGDRRVRDVMTPRPDMTVADATLPLSAIADLFVKTKHTRIPLVEGGVEKPVGFVHVKDVFAALRSADPPSTARPLGREVLFAPESQTVTTLLADFRRRRQHLAIVVDEYGAVVGLVTLEDLVAELVGEIADEHEQELDPIIPLAGGGFSLAGRVRVSEVAALFDADLPPGGYDTVGGLVSTLLGRIPKPGETVTEGGLRFVVDESDRKRIHRVKVQRAEELVAAEEKR